MNINIYMYVLFQLIIIFQKEALTIFKIYFFIYYNIKYNKKIGILNTKKLYIYIDNKITYTRKSFGILWKNEYQEEPGDSRYPPHSSPAK